MTYSQQTAWRCLALAFLFLPAQKLLAHDAITYNRTFNETVVFELEGNTRQLFITGKAIRKKFFLDIYSMAHYLEIQPELNNKEPYQQILDSDGAKQISMVFMRSLSAKQIRKSLLEGIKRNSDAGVFVSISSHVDEFMQSITKDVDINDEFIVRWLPDGTTISYFQGAQINSVKSPVFAKTLWSIWFGNESVIDRKKLVERLFASS